MARQYSGTLERVGNCQVVVTTHYVDRVFEWPVEARIYLPEAWAIDPERRRKARVPNGLGFRTKGQIGLVLVDEALERISSPVPWWRTPATGISPPS